MHISAQKSAGDEPKLSPLRLGQKEEKRGKEGKPVPAGHQWTSEERLSVSLPFIALDLYPAP